MKALIGYTGFVGSTLQKQTKFDAFFRSTNISEIENKSFDFVVCAAAPAQKWIANREPENDLQKIDNLINHLKKIKCETFVLISTVDVFMKAIDVDESTKVDETNLHAYGKHRRKLEMFVESHFPNHLIVRLPGLVGPGLRKNVIFDFLNENETFKIDSRGKFQFYPMVNLWYDINIALEKKLKLVHLTAEPISVEQVASEGFGIKFKNILSNQPATYNFKSLYTNIFNGSKSYQYSLRETIQAIRSYAQSETVTKSE